MSVLLRSTPVLAAVSPSLSQNLLSSTCAALHGITNNTSFVELPITVSSPSLYRATTTVLPFVIINEDIRFDVVFGAEWEPWCRKFKVACPLLEVDVPPEICYNLTSSDDIHDNLNVSSSCEHDLPSSSAPKLQAQPLPSFDHHHHMPSSPPIASEIDNGQRCPSSSSCEAHNLHLPLSPSCAGDPKLSPHGHRILSDMFLSQRDTGVRASIFHCSEHHLRKMCLLHGLDVSRSLTVRDVKLRLLYHLMNGDCFAHRCEPCQPSPDRSACICVATGLSSALSITSVIVKLLKDSTPSKIATEDLLLIVESTGNQSPYDHKINLRRRVIASLDAFLLRCRHRAQRDAVNCINDPFGDLFMGFEGKRKPVLESIMNHHGLIVEQQTKFSLENMRDAIVSHIAAGHCAHSIAKARPWLSQKTQTGPICSQQSTGGEKNDSEMICNDFVQDAGLHYEDRVENEIKVLNKVLEKSPSRTLLLRFLRCKDIPHDASQSRKRLKITLTRFVRLLEKRRIKNSDTSLHSNFDDWPSVVPKTLKDKIAENFRNEISREKLSSFVCCSCSSSTFMQQHVTRRKDDCNLSCLQHPEMRLSGLAPDMSRISNTNLHTESLAKGLLLDKRGVEKDTLSFCTDCSAYVQKGKTPPLSLANNLLLGDIPPELQDLTVVEESVIARCRAKVCIIQLRAEDSDITLPNTQRGMRGHIVIFPQKPDALLHILPPSMEDICTPICVVFIGSQHPTQEWLRRYAKPLIVRRERIRSALLWLKAHNNLYRNIVIDEQSLNTFPTNDVLPVHIELIKEADAGDVLTSRYDAPQPKPQAMCASNDNVQPDNKAIFDSVVVTGLAGDATMNQMRAAAMMHMKTNGGGFLQIPHSDQPANEFYNPNLLPATYPTLFPYGLGGFEDLQRTTPLSFKRQVKHFFTLADSRFQEHYSFLFTVFNILQRRAILLQTSLKVKRSSFDSFAHEFQGISSEAIQRVCERLSQCSDGSVFKNMTAEEHRVMRLMKEVNVINSHVPGTSAARVAMRNEIRALIMDKGLPSFYITINPADIYNPLVKFLAGSDIDINNLLPEQVPDYMEQSILVAKNPFVAARFFNIYLKAFLKTVLGCNLPHATDICGMLGPVSAYYGCVEAQGRGTLHCHMMVWLKGALNCDQIRERVLSGDTQFQARMINFIDDCISNEIPHIPPEPIVVPSDNVHPCSVRGITDLKASIARSKDLHNVIKSCQSHKHSATCYKYWKQGQPRECRFGLGEQRYRKNTEFDLDTGELQMRCLDGLVNNFNSAMIELIRCNMDIQFLGSGPSTKAVIYYITDYITKAQLKTHVAYAALALAVQKLEQTTAKDDPITRAKRLLQKCAFSMLGQQELSGQQVASYLVDLEDHFSSHDFQPMYWTSYECIVNKMFPITHPEPSSHCVERASEDEVEQTTTNDDSNDIDNDMEDDANTFDSFRNDDSHMEDIVVSANSAGELQIRTPYIQDYLLRGADLKSMNVWEYTSLIQKVSKKRARCDKQQQENPLHHPSNDVHMSSVDDGHSRPKYEFDPNHPDYDTHVQQLRHPNNRPLPAPVGPSLPRRDKCETHERFCRLMLILLKPWNAPQDLIFGHESFEAAFHTFLEENERWNVLINNMQLLHECRDSRDDHFENRSRTRSIYVAHEGTGRPSDDDDNFQTTDAETINTALLNHLLSIDESRSLHMNESQEMVNQCLQEAHLHGLFNLSEQRVSEAPDRLGVLADNNTSMQEQDWAHEYERRKQEWRCNVIAEQQQNAVTDYVNSRNIHNNMITHLDNPEDASINQTPYDQLKGKSKNENITNMHKTLSQFKLNDMQTLAYKTIAEHSFAENPEQLRMFIAGPGGTGKSWLIDALRNYFHTQNQDYRLRLASYTGVASRNIQGMTLHSALCLNKQNKRSAKAKMNLIAMWRKVNYLIIDEVSMIGCQLMLRIHETLCEAKENSNLFGGINIIFVGDFAQLPPVGDTRLYSRLEKERVGSQKGQKNVFGRLLWLSIDKVIILKEIVRQNIQKDPQFTQLLSRLRVGSCTDEDYDFLTRKQLRNIATDFSNPIWAQAPIIVSNNDVKDRLNLESATSFAVRTNQPLHFYYASDKRKGKAIDDSGLRDKLWSYHSGKTEQHMGMLPLCKGMPVMVTQNYDVPNGIVNGCIGTLEKVNYTIDDDGHRHAHSCVIHAEKTSGPCLPHLKDHEIVVLADETPLTFTHPHSHVRTSFQRSQLPITPAFAMTAHKSQGNTLTSAILDIESCLSTEAVYVMLSRVKKSDNIRILRPFRKAKIATRISEDLRREFRRLEFLHTQTLESTATRLEINASLGRVHDLEKIEKWYNDKLYNTPHQTGRP